MTTNNRKITNEKSHQSWVMGHKSPAGFTLVEVLITVTIITIISTVGIVNYTGFIQKSAIEKEASLMVAEVRATMSKARGQQDSKQWWMNFESDGDLYTVCSGDAYSEGSNCGTNGTIDSVRHLSSGVTFIDPETGNKAVEFTKATGLPKATLEIKIEVKNLQRTIFINSNGNVSFGIPEAF